MQRLIIRLCVVFFFVSLSSIALAQSQAEAGTDPLPAAVPVPDTVTMVDLGAHACIPCKMMAPILTELEQEYADRAAILFIDVWQHPGQREKFGIKSIPTQIFFDHTGREIYRHVGFYPKKNIVRVLDRLLKTQDGK